MDQFMVKDVINPLFGPYHSFYWCYCKRHKGIRQSIFYNIYYKYRNGNVTVYSERVLCSECWQVAQKSDYFEGKKIINVKQIFD